MKVFSLTEVAIWIEWRLAVRFRGEGLEAERPARATFAPRSTETWFEERSFGYLWLERARLMGRSNRIIERSRCSDTCRFDRGDHPEQGDHRDRGGHAQRAFPMGEMRSSRTLSEASGCGRPPLPTLVERARVARNGKALVPNAGRAATRLAATTGTTDRARTSRQR